MSTGIELWHATGTDLRPQRSQGRRRDHARTSPPNKGDLLDEAGAHVAVLDRGHEEDRVDVLGDRARLLAASWPSASKSEIARSPRTSQRAPWRGPPRRSGRRTWSRLRSPRRTRRRGSPSRTRRRASRRAAAATSGGSRGPRRPPGRRPRALAGGRRDGRWSPGRTSPGRAQPSSDLLALDGLRPPVERQHRLAEVLDARGRSSRIRAGSSVFRKCFATTTPLPARMPSRAAAAMASSDRSTSWGSSYGGSTRIASNGPWASSPGTRAARPESHSRASMVAIRAGPSSDSRFAGCARCTARHSPCVRRRRRSGRPATGPRCPPHRSPRRGPGTRRPGCPAPGSRTGS